MRWSRRRPLLPGPDCRRSYRWENYRSACYRLTRSLGSMVGDAELRRSIRVRNRTSSIDQCELTQFSTHFVKFLIIGLYCDDHHTVTMVFPGEFSPFGNAWGAYGYPTTVLNVSGCRGSTFYHKAKKNRPRNMTISVDRSNRGHPLFELSDLFNTF